MTSIPVFFSNGSQDTWQRVCYAALLKLFSITLRKQSPNDNSFIVVIFVTALRMMQLRLQKCDCVIEVHDARISFSVQKFVWLKESDYYANLLSRAFIQHLNPPPPPHPATPPQPASGWRRWRPGNKADLKFCVWSPVCNGDSKE